LRRRGKRRRRVDVMYVWDLLDFFRLFGEIFRL
jgi:hypothetical protein